MWPALGLSLPLPNSWQGWRRQIPSPSVGKQVQHLPATPMPLPRLWAWHLPRPPWASGPWFLQEGLSRIPGNPPGHFQVDMGSLAGGQGGGRLMGIQSLALGTYWLSELEKLNVSGLPLPTCHLGAGMEAAV